MSATIPNLRPNEFKVDVQTPLVILRVQAEGLAKVTRGSLEAEVETEAGEKSLQHRLVVIAPAYNSCRLTLLTAVHDIDLPYPVELRAEGLGKELPGLSAFPQYSTADGDDEMIDLVQRALTSSQTRSLILSLIAKSNESRQGTASTDVTEGDPGQGS